VAAQLEDSRKGLISIKLFTVMFNFDVQEYVMQDITFWKARRSAHVRTCNCLGSSEISYFATSVLFQNLPGESEENQDT
jgi:hypothetical protein